LLLVDLPAFDFDDDDVCLSRPSTDVFLPSRLLLDDSLLSQRSLLDDELSTSFDPLDPAADDVHALELPESFDVPFVEALVDDEFSGTPLFVALVTVSSARRWNITTNDRRRLLICCRGLDHRFHSTV